MHGSPAGHLKTSVSESGDGAVLDPTKRTGRPAVVAERIV
jgi:hypothetical protein